MNQDITNYVQYINWALYANCQTLRFFYISQREFKSEHLGVSCVFSFKVCNVYKKQIDAGFESGVKVAKKIQQKKL
jgi:hypothetical protein